MSDLIERIRAFVRHPPDTLPGLSYGYARLMHEAADIIAQQAAEIARLNDELAAAEAERWDAEARGEDDD